MTVWRAGRRWRGSTLGTAPPAAARWGPRWPAPGGTGLQSAVLWCRQLGTVSQFAYYIETKTRFYPIHICLIFLVNYECKYLSAGRVSVS